MSFSSPTILSLFVEKLPKHPEYAKASPEDKARIKKLLKQVFPRAMELKEKLKEQFEKEKADMEEKIAAEVCAYLTPGLVPKSSHPSTCCLQFECVTPPKRPPDVLIHCT